MTRATTTEAVVRRDGPMFLDAWQIAAAETLADIVEGKSAHRWVTSLDGRRDICLHCNETRQRETRSP